MLQADMMGVRPARFTSLKHDARECRRSRAYAESTNASCAGLDDEAWESLRVIFEHISQVGDRENGNGRAARNLLERAKRAQALRLMALEGRKSREQLCLLTAGDFEESLTEIQAQAAQ